MSSAFDQYVRLPPPSAPSSPSSDSDSDDDLEGIPLSHSFPLTQTKRISSLKFTSSGNRLLSSTRDCLIDVYDFQSMNPTNTTPLRSFEPVETHEIVKLDINPQNQILAIPNATTFKLLSGDGVEVQEFKSGDRYIYDVKQTKGHTDIINDGLFHGDKAITCSNDSTFRIWDLKGKQDRVNFIKAQGKKCKVTHVDSTRQFVISGDNADRVLFWDWKSNFNRPTSTITTKGLCTFTHCTTDDTLILIRDQDSLKLYDTRNLSQPMIQRLNFPSTPSNLVFQDSHILAAQDSALHILDKSDLMTLTTVSTYSPVTALDWNSKINHIAIGTQQGDITLLFDPSTSKNGAMVSIQNKPKKRHIDEMDSMTTSATTQAYNMEELAELNRSKKKKEPKKQTMIWGTTDASKV